MRKIGLFIALSLSVLAFVSCRKDDRSAVNGDMMSFIARVGDGGEKTEIYDGVKMKWSEKDSIVINGKKFAGKIEGEGETAVFTGEALKEATYEAFYPMSLYKGENAYELPATQYYNGDNLSRVNPMYARSYTTDLCFHNICAIMKLVVKGDGRVKEIVVSAKDATSENPALLSGAFTIEDNASGDHYAKITSGGSTSLTLDCGDGVELKAGKDTTFYIALPQGEYADLVFTLKDGKGGIFSSSPMTRNLKAGKMQVRELPDVKIVDPNKLSGVFTVGMDNVTPRKVCFSKGNLQYCAKGSFDEPKLGESVGGTWRFADNQWGYIGNDNTNIAQSYEGWIDLFGWGTSGYNHGAACYQPWSTSKVNSDYNAYGSSSSNLSDSPGSADWGYSYCVQEDIKPYTTWRTLTHGTDGEWDYIFTKRDNAETLYGEGTIDGVNGVIILPDDWTAPAGVPEFTHGASAWSNVYTSVEWSKMESAGAVFLPAAGYRDGNSISFVGSNGYYGSSSVNAAGNYYSAYRLSFYSNGVNSPAGNYGSKCYGFSVRLVTDVK